MADTRMIMTASAAAVVTGLFAYAVYFDHRRRTSPEFRRQLRRNERKQARSEKEDAEAAEAGRLRLIRLVIDEAKANGYPDNVEEKEQYFQEQITIGESLSTNAAADPVQVALHFYNALKVYPRPDDLVEIYTNIVPKPILDVLAEMIAYDTTLEIGRKSTPSANAVQAAFASMLDSESEGTMPPAVGLD